MNKPKQQWRRADWIKREQIESDELLRKACAIMADTFRGLHNVPGIVKHFGYYIELCTFQDLATYDFDKLTRLVFGAHHHCCRVSVGPASAQMVRIRFHNRQPIADGRMMSERHPTIWHAVEKWRADHPRPKAAE